MTGHSTSETPFTTQAHWLGYDTRAQQEQRERSEGAERAGERRRDALAEQNERLHSGGEFDPPSITERENWQSYSHQELYDINVRSLGLAEAQAAAEAWRKIGQELKAIGPELQRDSQAAIEAGWEGDAADVAKASAEPLVKWMTDSGEAFHLTGNKIEEAGSAAGQAKAMVPEPQGFSVGRAVASSIPGGLVGGGMDALAQMRERQEAERAAQDTMQRVLTPTYENVDATVPVYPGLDGAPLPPPPPGEPPPVEAPPPPVVPGPGRDGGSGGNDLRRDDRVGGDHGGNDRGGNDRGGNDQGGNDRGGDRKVQPLPYPNRPAESDSSWVPDRPESPHDRTPSGPPRPPGSPQTPPVIGGPMPVGGGGGGGRVGGPAGGKAGGAIGSGPGSGVASGRTGTGAGNPPGPGGRAGVATPNVGAPGAGAGATAGGAGGGPRGAAGGMGAGNRGGQGGEDYEHEHPGWLQEQDDIWLDGMPKTAPPVFGE
ncbi:PPE domain-containing protein [Saccharopolyspora gloriosae]|uniref:PPE domain-containing protein n=1 Tax=Saccharopolyspora gloriosae TaxID=455344 RepID=UPI001FB8321F|nr:PPE domain-containing protein [Saccharopolyspora gloriosae]